MKKQVWKTDTGLDTYRVYQGIRLHLGKRSAKIILNHFLTTFEVNNIFVDS